ncbi:MAG: T9SS type A sorting domain-containing protein [Bacteroidia bacterium]|nr:T9SS type A sorting domain-containing protein [Bacteroidia bacterium]
MNYTCFFSALVVLLVNLTTVSAQTICHPSGNIFIVSNYDGGTLNLVIDQNIPNLKIGVVSYEAIAINLSGPFVSTVTEVRYAGYNSANNTNCTPAVPTTVISSTGTVIPSSISFAPPAPSANPNGNPNIICAYSCDTTSSQGGCNTVDQIEDYFRQVFPGGSVYAHRTQYGCYTGQVLLSNAGNCCASPLPALSLSVNVTNASCFGVCDGSATVVPNGGTAPYQVQWSNGPATATWDSLCAGIYYVTVTDSSGLSSNQMVSVVAPNSLSGTFSITPDNGSCNGAVILNPAGGNGGPYTFAWDSCGNAAGSAAANVDSLCAGSCCVFLTDVSGCVDTFCVSIPLSVGVAEPGGTGDSYLYPNPSDDGLIRIKGHLVSDIRIYDLKGSAVNFILLERGADLISLKIPASGVYQVKWSSEGRRYSARAVVQNIR